MIDTKERSLSIYVTGAKLRTTNPRITKSAFKRFPHRAHTICSEKYIKEKTVFNRHACREWTYEKISRKFS